MKVDKQKQNFTTHELTREYIAVITFVTETDSIIENKCHAFCLKERMSCVNGKTGMSEQKIEELKKKD